MTQPNIVPIERAAIPILRPRKMTKHADPQPTRKPRFSRPLQRSGMRVCIPSSWNELSPVSPKAHETVFVRILEKLGFGVASPIPLVGRYSKPRPWCSEELDACVDAHRRGVPVAVMSAALNRNPQDIIYRLLDACHETGEKFREVGLASTGRWSAEIERAARALFDAGLTAWRIAALFGVDFEGVEKALYAGRNDYGHAKRNPFGVCTEHKQEVNRDVLSSLAGVERVLDAFAGEGRFAAVVEELFPNASIECIEKDGQTFERGRASRSARKKTRWHHADNLDAMQVLVGTKNRFDVADLDPFVSCREQVDLVWPLLTDDASLFVTFGGEYRRSFIQTNRKAITRRYGFVDPDLPNSEYLEIVPSYFLGWLASEAAKNGFILELTRAVRYPNNCRFWTRVRRASPAACASWLTQVTTRQSGGTRWDALSMPRFSELRKASARTRSRMRTLTPSRSEPSSLRNG